MSPPPAVASAPVAPPAWQPVLLAALAGGMGWGIRGQYGHETGAMIAGVLVSLVLVWVFCPQAALLPAARAVAFGTIAMGFGGTMTYGQTIGLTQNAALIGNGEALRWGMLGLAVKGGLWIGFAGLFLGMGLGGVRYRPREVLALMLAALVLYGLGCWLLNRPFDPANQVLPRIYFSADWRWQPGVAPEVLKPRLEHWGGLLFALAGLWAWTGWARGDGLARRLALWGMVGGLGFPLGQAVQAYAAWNPEVFRSGFWAELPFRMGWWTWMETIFGAFMGGSLGLGLWLNRRRIDPLTSPAEISLPAGIEGALLALHVPLLLLAEFASLRAVDAVYDLGLAMGLIPLVAVAGGRWWPFLAPLPVVMLPIAGKTIRALVYGPTAATGPIVGWLVYGVLPVLATVAAAIWWGRRLEHGLPGREFARRALLLSAWLYFALNFAFFRFPWPWETWTGRTPNAVAFALCLAGLTLAAVLIGRTAPPSRVSRTTE